MYLIANDREHMITMTKSQLKILANVFRAEKQSKDRDQIMIDDINLFLDMFNYAELVFMPSANEVFDAYFDE